MKNLFYDGVPVLKSDNLSEDVVIIMNENIENVISKIFHIPKTITKFKKYQKSRPIPDYLLWGD